MAEFDAFKPRRDKYAEGGHIAKRGLPGYGETCPTCGRAVMGFNAQTTSPTVGHGYAECYACKHRAVVKAALSKAAVNAGSSDAVMSAFWDSLPLLDQETIVVIYDDLQTEAFKAVRVVEMMMIAAKRVADREAEDAELAKANLRVSTMAAAAKHYSNQDSRQVSGPHERRRVNAECIDAMLANPTPEDKAALDVLWDAIERGVDAKCVGRAIFGLAVRGSSPYRMKPASDMPAVPYNG